MLWEEFIFKGRFRKEILRKRNEYIRNAKHLSPYPPLRGTSCFG